MVYFVIFIHYCRRKNGLTNHVKRSHIVKHLAHDQYEMPSGNYADDFGRLFITYSSGRYVGRNQCFRKLHENVNVLLNNVTSL